MHEFKTRLTVPGNLRKDLFFSSGPKDIVEPYSSVSVGSIEHYSSEEIASAIERLPNVKTLQRSPYLNRWIWQRDSHFIEIQVDGDNTGEDGGWIGSILRMDCNYSELVELWLALHATHPAIYLHHPSCRMYTPCSFLEEVAMLALCPAFRDDDPEVVRQATETFEHYRSISGFPCRRREYAPHAVRSLFELPVPLGQFQCSDLWIVDDWHPRVGIFDREAQAQGISFFTYPTDDTVNGKYKSGFMVWVSLENLELVYQMAVDLNLIADWK